MMNDCRGKKSSKVLQYILIFACTICLSGCAMLLAPGDQAPPNFSKIGPGAERAAVEFELGDPLYDQAAEIRSHADRKCIYKYYIRHHSNRYQTVGNTIANNFVGFHEARVTVYYGFDGKVARVVFPKGEGPANLKRASFGGSMIKP